MTGSAVTVRRIGSVPERTASQTWYAITDLIAEAGSTAHASLLQATGIASMLIAEAYTRDAPIVVTPALGSRVRIYTAHGQDASDVIAEETPLAAWPTDDPGWAVSLPCGQADLDYAAAAVAQIPGVTVRDAALGLALDGREAAASSTAGRQTPLRVDTTWLES